MHKSSCVEATFSLHHRTMSIERIFSCVVNCALHLVISLSEGKSSRGDSLMEDHSSVFHFDLVRTYARILISQLHIFSRCRDAIAELASIRLNLPLFRFPLG